MASRSVNKVMLIGNVTKDPNLRYTPNGVAVCTYSIATNRSWTPSDGGERQERVDYHNIVAWGKLADISGSLLHKGDKIFVEGRLQNRDWKTEDGQSRRVTEIVAENMILLRSSGGGSYQNEYSEDDSQDYSNEAPTSSKKKANKAADGDETVTDQVSDVEDIADDIPF